ncbi:MAG TPA: class I SAM-dependent methyltransferase [Chloroflexota bacterium]|nr:class I SAM-dependent methyltransferase [Chloroflexota bacterium]
MAGEAEDENDDAVRKRVRAQFGANANAYVVSCVHAAGADLDLLVAWAEASPEKSLLDVATGGGHTALAMSRLYGSVVATDITQPMLDASSVFHRSKGVNNVTYEIADAEALPFDDESFDAVSCRIAPHHFPKPARFVSEAARVLKPGGIFLFEDSIVPGDPDLGHALNRVEWLRDESHVRSLGEAEWTSLIERAGLHVEERTIDRKRRDLADWFGRAQTPPERRREVERTFLVAGPAGREAFRLEFGAGGSLIAYTDEKLLIKARKAV